MFSGINNLESTQKDFLVLAGFAEHPFTQRSLELVEARLPKQVGTAYRNAIDFWSQIPAFSRFESLVERPSEVFHLHQRYQRSRDAHIEPPSPAMQVGLAEEWLRDALDEKATAPDVGSPPQINRHQTATAIRCIRFHDAVLLCLAGLYSVVVSRHRLTFELTETGRRSMIRRHWAMMLERGSQMSFNQNIVKLVGMLSPLIKKGGSIVNTLPEQMWQELELVFMDRFFSFGTGVAKHYPYPEVIQRVRAYCRWFAALEIARSYGEGALRIDRTIAKSAGLDLSLLTELEADRRNAPQQDKGIYRQGDCLSLGCISLVHAIEVGKSVVLPDKIYQPLTKWLEENFAIDYLQAYVNADDYLVRKGFKRKAENDLPRFDCDFSVYDRRRDLFFFVQAKLKRSSRLATVSHEIRELTLKNSAVTHGFDQIVQLRKRIEDASVVDAIRSRFPELLIDAESLALKSRYLVVHNIPEFNGLERDGVVMYEWNMFRNLLARGRMEAGSIGSQGITAKQVNAEQVLKIEDVDAVFEHFSKGMKLSRQAIDAAFSDYADGIMTFALPKTGSLFAQWFSRAPRVETPLI